MSDDTNNAENTTELVEATRGALRSVVDPEIGIDVIALGLIREIQISPEKAHILMIMTAPFCPYAPQMMEQVRLTAEATLERPTTIELSGEMWNPSMMEDGGEAASWGLF